MHQQIEDAASGVLHEFRNKKDMQFHKTPQQQPRPTDAQNSPPRWWVGVDQSRGVNPVSSFTEEHYQHANCAILDSWAPETAKTFGKPQKSRADGPPTAPRRVSNAHD